MVLTREEKLEKKREEYRRNKQAYIDRAKIYKEKNLEKVKDYQKIYHQENYERDREKNNNTQRIWRKTESGRKSKKITSFKYRGIIGNLEEIYEKYISTERCEECNVILTDDEPYNTNTTRCLDHDHKTGEFRNILCLICNLKRG